MKKSLALFLALLTLSILGFAGAWSLVDGTKEAITINETVLYGDWAQAAGLSVSSSYSYEDRLIWDSTYALSEAVNCHTDFRFSQTQEYLRHPEPKQFSLNLLFNFASSGSRILEVEEEESGFPMRPVIDVAGRTANGESRTETLSIADYYDYYPLSPRLEGGGIHFFSPGSMAPASDYFRLPVPVDHLIQVTVRKDAAGAYATVECSTVNGEPSLVNDSVVTDEGVYCIFSFYDSTSETPIPLEENSYGIHFIPLEQEKNSLECRLYFDRAERVYPLSFRSEPRALTLSPDGGQLLLFTWESERNATMLTVLDRKNMAVLQTLLLSDKLDFSGFQEGDGFLLVTLENGPFQVLCQDRQGRWDIGLSGDLSLGDAFAENIWNRALAYDGERLAVIAYNGDYSSECTHYLAVYDRDGLAYAGKYIASLDQPILEHTVSNANTDPVLLRSVQARWDRHA